MFESAVRFSGLARFWAIICATGQFAAEATGLSFVFRFPCMASSEHRLGHFLSHGLYIRPLEAKH